METVLITGANGLIAKHLSKLLKESGYEVLSLSRKPKGDDSFQWNPALGFMDSDALKHTDHIIHLAGAGIGDKRWSTTRKNEIRTSRVNSCELIFQTCINSGIKLKSFISASAIGYYGYGRVFTEGDQAGQGFLTEVCREWEQAADRFQTAGIRTVKIRTGIVLAADGGILPQMALPVRLGLGTAMGSGKQGIPWIHIDDLCQIYLKAIQKEQMIGAYNAVAPESINNRAFTKELAGFFHKPYWPVAIPAFLIRALLGERSELLLKGSEVLPSRLLETDFTFRYTKLKEALNSLYPD